MTVVHDPTAYEIYFFAIPSPREGKTFHALANFLNDAAATFAQGVGKDPPYRIQLEDFTVLTSERLTFVKPTQVSPGLTLELDVRTLHDTVMLRTTALHQGSLAVGDVKNLRFSTPLSQCREAVPNYLGTFRVYYVETDSQGPPNRAAVGKDLAKELGWTWLAGAEPISIPMGTMLFGVQPSPPHQRAEAPALDLLFVGGRKAAALAESYPLHPFLLTLPELALCHLKVRNSVQNLRLDWLHKLAERETELRDLLPQQGDRKQTLLEMLDRNDDITSRQARLVDAVVHVQAELRTMRINRDNFATAASAPPFDAVAEKLRHLLLDRWMRGTELQAENDLGYSDGALERAATHFKSIEARAEATGARQLKQINQWVIVLAVLQLLTGLLAAYLAWKALPAAPSSAPSQPPQATANSR